MQTSTGTSEHAPTGTDHSFVLKIWVEEIAERTGDAAWSGHITHVATNERRYVRRLQDITTFLEPYLLAMNVDLGVRRRLRHRFGRFRAANRRGIGW